MGTSPMRSCSSHGERSDTNSFTAVRKVNLALMSWKSSHLKANPTWPYAGGARQRRRPALRDMPFIKSPTSMTAGTVTPIVGSRQPPRTNGRRSNCSLPPSSPRWSSRGTEKAAITTDYPLNSISSCRSMAKTGERYVTWWPKRLSPRRGNRVKPGRSSCRRSRTGMNCLTMHSHANDTPGSG